MTPEENIVEGLTPECYKIAKNVEDQLKVRIKDGEQLLKNRPISASAYQQWDDGTTDIIKQSQRIDPLGSERFAFCGCGAPPSANEAYKENERAMRIYDKLTLLKCHLNTIRREMKNTGKGRREQ